MTDKLSEHSTTLDTALTHGLYLLATNPALAEKLTREILKSYPNHPQALLLLRAALRTKGDAQAAREIREPLASSRLKAADAHFELALSLADLGETQAAITTLLRTLQLDANLPHAWLALAEQYMLIGNKIAANDAYAQHIKVSVNDPQLQLAATALCENKLAKAEHLLCKFLETNPTNVTALRMLVETGTRLGHYEDVEKMLMRCIELASGSDVARDHYAAVLSRQNKPAEALMQVDLLLRRDPHNSDYRNMRASLLTRIGEEKQAISAYEQILKEFPKQPKVWVRYGDSLKSIGRQADAIAAYRESIVQSGSLGEGYWSLANLKTFRFAQAEVTTMYTQFENRNLQREDRVYLHFALGKAHEDQRQYAEAFKHYEKGNELRCAEMDYNADDTSSLVTRSKASFTSNFYQERKYAGCTSSDPIFIVGLPRSGSTLIEQILSSHSRVEGTMELPDIMAIVRRFENKKQKHYPSVYPEILAALDQDESKRLGEEYLERARARRRLGRAFFVDKMPNNFLYIGLIHLILPNAKIIDARRHPMSCCFSCFKQLFARGQGFTYSLTDIGRYYSDYAELMSHFDKVLPGRIHRVFYEQMVDDPEAEIRRLLEYCGLPFEEACLHFYQTKRVIRSASSEQVRIPIFTEAVNHWRNFEPWLGPLKLALGAALTTYTVSSSHDFPAA